MLVMADYALPPLAALLLWWLGTGAVIVMDRAPRDSAVWTRAAATLLAFAALLGIGQTAASTSALAAYAGFTGAVMLWGWHELSFLGGWLTGPRKHAASSSAHGWNRLREAVQVLLWHELALLATVALLWLWLGRSANPVAAWTFTLLWVMRLSAKVNLYLGVRNLALDVLPPRLRYLGSYFRQRRMNPLMPWSLLAGGAIVVALVVAASSAGQGARATLMLLASLLALALVEHLMMVLPVQPSALWRWALR